MKAGRTELGRIEKAAEWMQDNCVGERAESGNEHGMFGGIKKDSDKHADLYRRLEAGKAGKVGRF